MTASRERDAAAVSAVLAGDEAAFRQLFASWQRSFLRHASRLLSDPEAAKDAVQDTWIEIHRHLDRLEDRTLFGVWAFRILTRRCHRSLRRRYRWAETRQGLASEALVTASLASSFAATSDDRLDAAKVRQALSGLPKEQWLTMELYHLEGFTVAETAVALGVPPGTVKTRLMHARRKIKAHLMGEEA